MAAFTSNIDITSGGTYNMNITNGEPASQVATDLNGKFANIQQYLQNGLPEVWTGSSLPDSLPDGKYLTFNGNPYHQLSQLCKITDIQPIISNYGALRQTQGTFQVSMTGVPSSGTITLNHTSQFLICSIYTGGQKLRPSYSADSNTVPWIVTRYDIIPTTLIEGFLYMQINNNQTFSWAFNNTSGYEYINTIYYISFYIS